MRTHAREGGVLLEGRVICGAQTRKGRPCRLMSEPSMCRCKFHDGKSTGPKTDAGKPRISAALRLRWAAYRAQKSSWLIRHHQGTWQRRYPLRNHWLRNVEHLGYLGRLSTGSLLSSPLRHMRGNVTVVMVEPSGTKVALWPNGYSSMWTAPCLPETQK